MANEYALRNARLILRDRVAFGSLLVRDGSIVSVDEGRGAVGEDMEGDYIAPGLVELHTDHLEAHFSPRPGVRWDALASIQAHDAQIAGSGITTVFDCLRLGSDENGGFAQGEMRMLADRLRQAWEQDRLRAEHRLHLRCELSSADLLDQFRDFEDDPQVSLVSLMDHTPGQRQFTTMEQYELYYKTSRGMSDKEFGKLVERRKAASMRFSPNHRRFIAEHCARRNIAVASHDDATAEHIDEAIGFGVRLAEFPTSMEAAKAGHGAGMSVLMGAPNVVRGKSHSGNIAAIDLADADVLDVLSSDYVPFSLVHAPFVLADTNVTSLAAAFAMVTDTPARTVGLEDRGRLDTGLRADIVRLRHDKGVPVVRSVWREGRRVA